MIMTTSLCSRRNPSYYSDVKPNMKTLKQPQPHSLLNVTIDKTTSKIVNLDMGTCFGRRFAVFFVFLGGSLYSIPFIINSIGKLPYLFTLQYF